MNWRVKKLDLRRVDGCCDHCRGMLMKPSAHHPPSELLAPNSVFLGRGI
jgi:hypothetical protein